MHLSTGWQCNRICHLCTGRDWHDPRDTAAWNTGGPGPTPFKDGSISPLLDVQGCHSPTYVQLDWMHCFHLGYGIDLAANCIVLLAKLGYFSDARALNDQLKVAYEYYSSWCKENKRVTSLIRFSKLDFDMTLKPGLLVYADL